MKDIEKIIVDTVYEFYIKSSDFNGIPFSTLSKKVGLDGLNTIDKIKSLVERQLIVIQSGFNPHIIGVGIDSIEDQLSLLDVAKHNESKETMRVETGERTVIFTVDSVPLCLYPSQQYLLQERDVSEFSYSPFTKQLALGQPQLKPFFFEIEVLERYQKDPRYSFQFHDYSGQISYAHDDNDVPLVMENDQIFLQSFGLGVDSNLDRVVVVYLRYLKDLTSEHQIFWKSKEVSRDCQMRLEYYQNTIEGSWATSHSVFSAFLEEQKALNDLSLAIGVEPLFNSTFESENRPKEFTFFFIPTLQNYHSFVLLLDKMISDNINKNFFKNQNIQLFEYSKVDEFVERQSKGTLRLLEEWLTDCYYSGKKDLAQELLKSFKDIRKERQAPAHKINENVFDKSLVEKQIEIITQSYFSMQILRRIFQRHPKARGVEIKNWLDNGEIKIF